MSIRRPGWKGLVDSALVIGAAASVTYGALVLAGVNFGLSGSAEQSTHNEGERIDGTSVQAQPTRQVGQLTICVDVVDVDPAVRALAKEKVEAALPGLAQHVGWTMLRWNENPPVVDIGCPSQPYPITSGVPFAGGFPVPLSTLTGVSQPSYYAAFVFVFPSVKEIDELLGGSEIRAAAQEWDCEGPSGGPPCWEIRSAVYLAVAELSAGPEFLVPLLAQGSGLEARGQ
jgi:hypothetical protein